MAPPIVGKMVKGIALCYVVVAATFYSVSIAGYWAFGNGAQGNIFDNLAPSGGPQVNPVWLTAISSFAIVAQLLAIGLVRRYTQFCFANFLVPYKLEQSNVHPQKAW
jgi:hypothetical protein